MMLIWYEGQSDFTCYPFSPALDKLTLQSGVPRLYGFIPVALSLIRSQGNWVGVISTVELVH